MERRKKRTGGNRAKLEDNPADLGKKPAKLAKEPAELEGKSADGANNQPTQLIQRINHTI